MSKSTTAGFKNIDLYKEIIEEKGGSVIIFENNNIIFTGISIKDCDDFLEKLNPIYEKRYPIIFSNKKKYYKKIL